MRQMLFTETRACREPLAKSMRARNTKASRPNAIEGNGSLEKAMPVSSSGTQVEESQAEEGATKAEVTTSNLGTSRQRGCRESGNEEATKRLGTPVHQCRESSSQEDKAVSVSPEHVLDLIEGQGFRCNLCGITVTPQDARLDHITPRVDGGADEIENLQWLCDQCNRAKGTLSQRQFILMCRRVANRLGPSGKMN